MSRSSWKAQVLIIMTKHNAILKQHPDLPLSELAKKLNSNPSTISKIVTIYKNLSNPAVSNCVTLASAYAATRRKNSKTVLEISDSATEVFDFPRRSEAEREARSGELQPETDISETSI